MKPICFRNAALAISLAGGLLVGCGKQHDHAKDEPHDHDHEDAAGHSHNADGSHSDSVESFSGATHKEGRGITLLEETRKLLGLATTEVREERLSREIRFAARVFGEGNVAGGQSSVALLAHGNVSTNDAVFLREGLAVTFTTASGGVATGEVKRVVRLLANDDPEVIVALPAAAPALKNGDSGDVKVIVPGEKEVLVVPREAVIRCSTGDLVYAVNGDAYMLTWVELGAQSDGLVEITDGLLVGDSVVTRGAMDLWLVELRAMKGGQGCCPAPPKKGKD